MSAVDPHGLLAHVHPDLVRLVHEAALHSMVGFEVIAGLRTPAQEAVNVAKGASTTMHSRHLPNAQGLACAVDVAAVVAGHISWDVRQYTPIAEAFKAASEVTHVPFDWGGAWSSFRDFGHFQLPWHEYP